MSAATPYRYLDTVTTPPISAATDGNRVVVEERAEWSRPHTQPDTKAGSR